MTKRRLCFGYQFPAYAKDVDFEAKRLEAFSSLRIDMVGRKPVLFSPRSMDDGGNFCKFDRHTVEGIVIDEYVTGDPNSGFLFIWETFHCSTDREYQTYCIQQHLDQPGELQDVDVRMILDLIIALTWSAESRAEAKRQLAPLANRVWE